MRAIRVNSRGLIIQDIVCDCIVVCCPLKYYLFFGYDLDLKCRLQLWTIQLSCDCSAEQYSVKLRDGNNLQCVGWALIAPTFRSVVLPTATTTDDSDYRSPTTTTTLTPTMTMTVTMQQRQFIDYMRFTFPFLNYFLTPPQWCCFMFISTFVHFLPLFYHILYFVSHIWCSVHPFCHLICLYPVPLKVIQVMELIQLAGRYRLQERIVSGSSSRTYGVIASHRLILLTGWIHRWSIFCIRHSIRKRHRH